MGVSTILALSWLARLDWYLVGFGICIQTFPESSIYRG
ncbi:hypothetical protein SAMN06269185_1556 [Natronoarchaeum philippinense]|uniref:Biopterin-dependent aromatic amino acid hydroxylase family profile domain-containing protein n=1 Tax=Natronoarchaeum philippinense TaxID=558529 RepID=A0A285NRZ0_NATPI|nr:hypothetical protein SAMN06269185_1556 [Natronoarchaeum philippinense]